MKPSAGGEQRQERGDWGWLGGPVAHGEQGNPFHAQPCSAQTSSHPQQWLISMLQVVG